MNCQNGLLQVVDRRERACPSNACRAVQDYFVIGGDVGELLGIQDVLPAALAPVVHAQVLNDRLDYLVVLLLRSTEVWPSQVLQLGYDSLADDLASGVFLSQLQASLD